MKLNRIDHAIETCKQCLDNTEARGTEIESYLTRYLLILINVVFEDEIKKIVAGRAAQTEDPAIESFVNSAVERLLRSIKISEISGFLNKFGSEYKSDFSDKITNTRAETCFNTIINNRHLTAHTSGPTMTFNELITFYEEGHKVLDELGVVIMGNSPIEPPKTGDLIEQNIAVSVEKTIAESPQDGQITDIKESRVG